MKAIIYERYGGPEVLQLKTVEMPVAGDEEILVKIHAAAANPLDWHFMRGTPFIMRLMSGLITPKAQSLGVDLAGEVVAAGSKVCEFQVGDRIFGTIPSGAYAEFVAVPESSPLIKIPATLTYEQAACLPVAGITALQGLRDAGGLRKGEKLLINGASGGVGTFAVQLAVYYGATVTGVCSGRNMDRVRRLGAAGVIDYNRDDFSRTGEKYDLIFDLVGNRPVRVYRRALRSGGRAILCGFNSTSLLLQHLVLGPISSLAQSRKVAMMPTARPNKPDLGFLASLAAGGLLKPVIDRRYELAELPDAIRYLETGRARGKLIISTSTEAGGIV